MEKLGYEVQEYNMNEDRVIILIVSQKYRQNKFYPKNEMEPACFVASNGFNLASYCFPEYQETTKTCYVQGSYSSNDRSKLIMNTKDFKLFHEAVKEYNEKR